MCGRTVFTIGRRRIKKVTSIEDDSLMPERVAEYHSFNLAPTKPLVCVTESPPSRKRSVEVMSWGIDPKFETEKHLSTINARVEGVAKSRMYSPLLDAHRCVVIVDAFYEWDQTTKVHTPHLIRFGASRPEIPIPLSHQEGSSFVGPAGADDETDTLLPPGVSPLFLAAIYDRSKTTGQNKCSILTMDSRGCVSRIHSRMPVLLTPDSAKTWLGDAPFSELIDDVLVQSQKAALDLECTEVSSLVNSVAHQSRDVTLPVLEMKKRSFEKGLGRFFSKEAKKAKTDNTNPS